MAIVDVNPAGARRQQRAAGGFRTKAEAASWVAEIQAGKKRGNWVDPSKLTLGAYLDRWWEAGQLERWEANTAREYGISIRLHIKPYLGSVSLQSLRTDDIKALYKRLLKPDDDRRPLSRKTVANVNVCLRAALNDAVEADPPLLNRNPAAKAFTYSRRKHRVEMKTWSAEEVQAFLAFTALDRDSMLYRLALMTGMRRGELLGLRHVDLKLETAQLLVRRKWTRDGARGLAIKGLKNDSTAWRSVDLDPMTVDLLRTHQRAQEFERRRDDYRRDLNLVFAEPNGSPLDPDSVTRRFARRTARAGLPRLRFHDLRHTRATLLLEHGAPINYVAEQLGDTKETVMETYAHVTPKMRSAAVAAVAAAVDTRPAAPTAEVQS
jgi:integrase